MTPINFKRLSLGVAIPNIHTPIQDPPLEPHVLTSSVRIFFFFFEASTGVGQEPKPHHLSGLISFSHHFLRALLGPWLQVQLGTSPSTFQSKIYCITVLTRVQRNWDPHTLLVGIQNGTVVMENGWVVPQRAKHRITT